MPVLALLLLALMHSGTAEPITLRVGATAPVQGSRATVTFEGVRDDSRCPRGVTCIWEGDAVAVFRVQTRADDAVVVELHANPGFAREGSAHGVTLSLERLAPEPEADAPVPAGAYVVTLRIGVR